MSTPTDKKRRPWLPITMVLVVVVAAIGWTAIWFIARDRADAAIERAILRQQERGREWTCADQKSGGYPFRLTYECSSVALAVRRADGTTLIANAGKMTAVARAYAPGHVIILLEGPFTLNEAGKSLNLVEADWAQLRMSLKGRPRQVDAFDLEADELTGIAPGLITVPGADNPFSAKRLEFHGRLTDRTGAVANADIAFSASTFAYSPNRRDSPALDLRFLGSARNVPVEARDEPVVAFAEQGGELTVSELRLDQSGSSVDLRGVLSLDGAYRPQGRLAVTAAGDDLRTPGAAGAFGGMLPIIAMALRFAGAPAELDGKKASTAQIDISNGDIRLGPVQLGRVPSLR